MPNDNFRIIDSTGQKVYIQFDQNSDIQLDMLRNELAKTLLETYPLEKHEALSEKLSD